jgi:hypothetical protein
VDYDPSPTSSVSDLSSGQDSFWSFQDVQLPEFLVDLETFGEPEIIEGDTPSPAPDDMGPSAPSAPTKVQE